MANIIVATEEQIQEAVFNAVSKFFSGNQQVAPSSDLPDTLSMPNALKVLEDNGFPTSKAKLYKMTSQEQIPFMKYGNKLVFSRKALIEWAHKQFQTVAKIVIPQSTFRNVSNVNAKIYEYERNIKE